MKYLITLFVLTILAACGTNWVGNGRPFYYVPKQGEAGTSCTVEEVAEGALIVCEDGKTALIKHGNDGATGSPGQSCEVQQVEPGDEVLPLGGALILCPSTTALVSNGSQGVPGLNGLDAAPVEVLFPCGNTSNHSEILLKLPNGQVVASFSAHKNGNYTRLSLLVPGVQYMTTDQQACYFQVDAQGNLVSQAN